MDDLRVELLKLIDMLTDEELEIILCCLWRCFILFFWFFMYLF